MKPKLFISFSGGKSSAFMLYYLITIFGDKYEIVVVFANTGWEREETLIFVERCAKEWGVKVVWVEAVVLHGERASSQHRIVDFSSASRNCEPFIEVIKKYGIPNVSFPHCTRELKTNPMYSYIRSIGWKKGAFKVAIGMRADEEKRRRKDAEAAGIVYPLMDWLPTDKADINLWWEDQSFSLGLQEHEGNCKGCWKKSFTKHFRLMQEHPEIYDFTRSMEAQHGLSGANKDGNKRVFFRGHRSTEALFAMAKETGSTPIVIADQDANSGCTESCEAFAEAFE